MDEGDLKKFLDDNKDAILKDARARLVEYVSGQMRYSLPESYAQTVNTFLAEEIAPELKTLLMGQKGAIIEAVTVAAAQIGDEIAKAMVTKATKALTGYDGKKILEALVGGY